MISDRKDGKPMKQKRNRKQERDIYICGLILAVLLALWLGAEQFLKLKFSFPPCLLHSLTGLYCPGCGGTRACRLLLSGHIFQSFLYHPGVLPAAVLYLWYMTSHTIELLSKGQLRISLPYSDKFLYLEAAIILLQCLVKNLVKILWGMGIF